MPLTQSALKTYLDAASWGSVTKPTTLLDDSDQGIGEFLWIKRVGNDRIKLVGNNVYTRARDFELTYLTANEAAIDQLETLLKAYTTYRIPGISTPVRNKAALAAYLISIVRFTMTNFET